MNTPYNPVSPSVNFPALEQEILAFWDREKIFEKSVERPSQKSFSFYDGPPFATGLPHYGHLLAGTLKDSVPRYWTMKGHSVARRFGWDCHGVPVEFEINKTLNLHSRKDILEFGVARYNDACRSIVTRYSTEWKKTVHRLGRWVDMDNAYFTMNVEFMQSVWWVFQELYKKGLIYDGYKVVPYSTGVSTPLSNFEANLDYREVQDPAITVSFPLDDALDTAILAWTTTPWTLPSNLALAVNSEMAYVKVRETATGKKLILAEARLAAYSKEVTKDFEILETMQGSALLGKTYAPLFPFFETHKKDGAFRVISSSHVTADSGTGIVHMAPAYGEEDFNACKAAGIALVNPVDDDGVFTSAVPPFAGKKVKDADKEIILALKTSGRLYKQETLLHSYPYCYRSGTPLIYRAVSSWFVAVEKIKEQILEANATTTWVPEHLRDGRFGKWLENARDWALSRNRFWGTPIPIWKNKEGEVLCIGSKEELERLSGKKINDLHKEHVDQIEIPSPTGKSPLKRVDEVLDCWFESGSMPYAQWGFPFENKEKFEENFPADFIAEGLDQTRGWFYTLMVIGTGLFGKAPFKNVIVNGIINAEDGKKMSKSLKNYPDPMRLIDEHGADALRLYLIDSPAVKAEEIRFSEKGVRDIVRRVMLRFWNAYSFFVSYANIDGFVPSEQKRRSKNPLDQWVLSRLNRLIDHTNKEMAAYRLYSVVPELLDFIESLTNTYIRLNRAHFWKEGMPEDKVDAYETLHHVLLTLSKVVAPFAPFLSEACYLNLSQVAKERSESVHLEMFPEADLSQVNRKLESAVDRMETALMLGRNLREKHKIKAKIPLLNLTLIHRDGDALDSLRALEPYIKEEMNVREISYARDESTYVEVKAHANFPVLGKRVGGKMKAIAAQIAKLPLKDIEALEKGETLVFEEEVITLSDLEIRRSSTKGFSNVAADQLISIQLDTTLTEELIEEGNAREIFRKVQQARKNAKLDLSDRIELALDLPEPYLSAVKAHEATLKEEALIQTLSYGKQQADMTFSERVELDDGAVFEVSLRRHT
jgi:isoleucyl-tRNA synthetase